MWIIYGIYTRSITNTRYVLKMYVNRYLGFRDPAHVVEPRDVRTCVRPRVIRALGRPGTCRVLYVWSNSVYSDGSMPVSHPETHSCVRCRASVSASRRRARVVRYGRCGRRRSRVFFCVDASARSRSRSRSMRCARRRCALRFDLNVGTAFKKLTREVGRRGFG